VPGRRRSVAALSRVVVSTPLTKVTGSIRTLFLDAY
jgi:hypothetical protein